MAGLENAFEGKTVLVTGGGKGVGAGITQAFLVQGAEVYICGRTEPETLPSHQGRTPHFIAADIRDADIVQSLIAEVVEKTGRLDVLVNNAGGAPLAEAATVSPRFSESIIQLNLLAPLHCAQAANTIMQAQEGGGVILNIASVSGTRGSPGTAAYGAAKAGLLNLTQSLAMEWGPKVRVNAIIVGLVETDQSHLHYGSEAAVKKIGATFPLGRMAKPDDIGDACLYLASSLAKYVSGAQLEVHGGGERLLFSEIADVDKS